MKIKKFDRDACKFLRNELQAAADNVAKHLGLKIHVGSMSYTNVGAKIKVEAEVVDKEGESLRAKQEFELYASRLGLKASDYGREFLTVDGDRVRIVGINLRRRKYPVTLEKSNGGRIRCTAGYVKVMKAVSSND